MRGQGCLQKNIVRRTASITHIEYLKKQNMLFTSSTEMGITVSLIDPDEEYICRSSHNIQTNGKGVRNFSVFPTAVDHQYYIAYTDTDGGYFMLSVTIKGAVASDVVRHETSLFSLTLVRIYAHGFQLAWNPTYKPGNSCVSFHMIAFHIVSCTILSLS